MTPTTRIETIHRELMQSQYTARIAAAVGMSRADYIDLVMSYVRFSHREAGLVTLAPDELQRRGLGSPSDDQVARFLQGAVDSALDEG